MKKYQLKVKDIIRETEDAISVVLEQPNTEKISFKPGQFLTLIFNLGGESIRRAYSLASCPYTETDLKVSIKKMKDGKISTILNNSLQKGDYLDVLEPMGVFSPEINSTNAFHYLLWAGGSGITPMMSMVKAILSQESGSRVSLIYANRSQDSIIFSKELDDLQSRFQPRLEVIHLLSQPHYGWNGYEGRLDIVKTKEIITKIAPTLPVVQFMCGPEGLMHTIAEVADIMGLPKPKKENFLASIEDSAQKKLDGVPVVGTKNVTVKYDGQTHQFDVPPDKTILEAALDLNIDLPYSCQSGLCTACMGKCTSGKVKLTEDDCLTDQELKSGIVLTCVAHPLTDDVVIEIE